MMKALVSKIGFNSDEIHGEGVILEPYWIDADEAGRPYTLDGYHYALCIDAPDGEIIDDDPRLDADNYRITSVQVEDEEGIEHTLWIAAWSPH